MFRKFLDAGITVAGIDVGESFGSPDGRALYTSLYREFGEKRHFSKKPCLLARCRDGHLLCNWAIEHPKSVSGIAGIYPVCDLRSYPGNDRASSVYQMTPVQLTEEIARHSPVDQVEPLARAGVPVLHIHGDKDKVVPLEANSAELARRYQKFGGEMKIILIEGRGHDVWTGWFVSQELVDFRIARARTVAGS